MRTCAVAPTRTTEKRVREEEAEEEGYHNIAFYYQHYPRAVFSCPQQILTYVLLPVRCAQAL
eukprot:8130534-Pyramimonas_sp.AAC.1